MLMLTRKSLLLSKPKGNRAYILLILTNYQYCLIFESL